ncbi:SsgA family sporulation/cell division regulator [Streptomyces sp. DSM 40750]|uniref:SsgA family sporulation/cell division regulator n=1 Tax=Streptomyces sp. DSM 40750 TaxID=2801030 RepID=UPI00214CD400|nr:SsgA family sporulation/cell division regulator [Streptomyces sp. DSM 40750]UUU19538.1 SsgA family sporulation/cell division regulator [Streptomyces sp. DSM 40750]UUU27118.1 SsgA family sporulation/cell division regulator [Streptomyces sp. DSM 40750]
MTVTLEQHARALLVTAEDQEVPVPASLRYSSDDPLAVHLDFPADISLNGSMVTWTFSRGLLEEGVLAPAGAGDVHIWPCGRFRTVVELHSPYGMALLQFEKAALQRFLLRSYAVVAAGREELGPSLDRGLASLLDGV